MMIHIKTTKQRGRASSRRRRRTDALGEFGVQRAVLGVDTSESRGHDTRVGRQRRTDAPGPWG